MMHRPRARLTAAQVREIRKIHRISVEHQQKQRGLTPRARYGLIGDLADRYNCSRDAIIKICARTRRQKVR